MWESLFTLWSVSQKSRPSPTAAYWGHVSSSSPWVVTKSNLGPIQAKAFEKHVGFLQLSHLLAGYRGLQGQNSGKPWDGRNQVSDSEKKGPDRWEPPYVTSMGEFIYSCYLSRAFSDGSELKNLPLNAGDTEDVSWIPGSGRCPGGGNGNPLKYSCLRNPMDRGAWRATESMGSQKSQTWLSD